MKTYTKDKRNYFVIARGSTFECAAIVHILYSESIISSEENKVFHDLLEEISRMLYVMIHKLKVQYKDNERAEK